MVIHHHVFFWNIICLFGPTMLYLAKDSANTAFGINSDCGYSDNFHFYAIPKNLDIFDIEGIGLFVILHYVWDCSNFVLYIIKIRSIRTKTENNPEIYTRICCSPTSLGIRAMTTDTIYLSEHLQGICSEFVPK